MKTLVAALLLAGIVTAAGGLLPWLLATAAREAGTPVVPSPRTSRPIAQAAAV
jgi:hypothetical protein